MYICRWSLIAGRLPGRTDNEIKNYWNTNLGKRVKDPRHHHAIASSSSRTTLVSAAHDHHKKLPTNTNYNDGTTTGVVHTKASKCSKVIISNPILMYNHNHNSEAMNNYKEEEEGAAANNNNDDVYDDQDGLLSAFGGHHHETGTDLVMGEFNMGDLCLSDLLNSDFSAEMCDFTTTYSNSDDILSPSCSDQPFHFSDDILNLNDWTHTTHNNNATTQTPHHHHNIDHLHSFNSYLHSPQQSHLPH